MIRQWQIFKMIADAVEASSDIQLECASMPQAPRVDLGNALSEPLAGDESRVVIRIGPSEDAYDLGHNGAVDRVVPVAIRWHVHDDRTPVDDGRRVTFSAVETAEKIGHAIVAAIQGITNLGDELRTAEMLISPEFYPVVVGELNCKFHLTRGTNYEPSITEP